MFRNLTLNDINAVAEIEGDCFLTPWTRKDIREHLEDGIGTVKSSRTRLPPMPSTCRMGPSSSFPGWLYVRIASGKGLAAAC